MILMVVIGDVGILYSSVSQVQHSCTQQVTETQKLIMLE
jgi:hypothetical protein